MGDAPAGPGNPVPPAAPVPAGGPPPAAPVDPAAKVKLPATLLLVFGGLGFLMNIAMLIYGLSIESRLEAELRKQGYEATPELLAAAKENIGTMHYVQTFGGFIISLAQGALMILGSLKMKKLQAHGLAMAGAIAAIVPCYGSCCILGPIAGIMAVLALVNKDVKAAFH